MSKLFQDLSYPGWTTAEGKKYRFRVGIVTGRSCLICAQKNPDDTAHVAKPLINESPEFSVSEESGTENFKEKVLRSVGDLPPMPEILIKAQKVMSDPNSSFQEIGRILETDQALAGRVLKLANSAAYGLSGMVSSIQHAAVVLGQKTLIEIVTVVGTSKFLGKQLNGYGLQHGDLWKHSLTVAFGSRIIARKKSPKLENDGFSAGLFHDAGKIVLDPYVLEKKKSFEEYLAGGQKTFSDAEKRSLDSITRKSPLNYAKYGTFPMCWRLPFDIIIIHSRYKIISCLISSIWPTPLHWRSVSTPLPVM